MGFMERKLKRWIFEPKPDITAYELAMIINHLTPPRYLYDASIRGEMPAEFTDRERRHFRLNEK